MDSNRRTIDMLLSSAKELVDDIRFGIEEGIYPADDEGLKIVERLDDAADEAKRDFEDLVEDRVIRLEEIDLQIARLKAEREELGG